jgi:hypothetical protein
MRHVMGTLQLCITYLQYSCCSQAHKLFVLLATPLLLLRCCISSLLVMSKKRKSVLTMMRVLLVQWVLAVSLRPECMFLPLSALLAHFLVQCLSGQLCTHFAATGLLLRVVGCGRFYFPFSSFLGMINITFLFLLIEVFAAIPRCLHSACSALRFFFSSSLHSFNLYIHDIYQHILDPALDGLPSPPDSCPLPIPTLIPSVSGTTLT